VIAIIVLKAIAYAASLGSGFRGGPFFPAMFVGAATGLLFSLVLPDGPSVAASTAVGVIAGVIATARMSWVVVLVLAVVLGLLMGGWVLVPAMLIGGVIARLVPRWGDRLLADH